LKAKREARLSPSQGERTRKPKGIGKRSRGKERKQGKGRENVKSHLCPLVKGGPLPQKEKKRIIVSLFWNESNTEGPPETK